MPIYEYQCNKCGHRFEVIQKVSDRPRKKCEKCKGRAERLISSPAIQFKGTGWYVTDYANKGTKEEAPKSSDSKSSDSESKPKKSSAKKKEKAGSST